MQSFATSYTAEDLVGHGRSCSIRVIPWTLYCGVTTEVNLIKLPLTPNQWSRPGKPMRRIKGLVVHWFEKPRQSARGVRDYFELRKDGKHGYGSAHVCIDPDCVIECVPESEMAYHVGSHSYSEMAKRRFGPYPNNCLLGGEWYHLDWNGMPDSSTWHNAVEWYGRKALKYGLNPIEDIVNHTEVTGKMTSRGPCHKWFYTRMEEFDRFRLEVKEYMQREDTD